SVAEGYTLTVANKVWGKRGLAFVPSYLQILETHFRGGYEEMDFSNVRKAVEIVNNWAAKNTNNKIRQVVSDDFFRGEMLLVLANAVYFKGTWLREFNPKQTRSEAFRALDG